MRFSILGLLALVGLTSSQDTSLIEVQRAFDNANIPKDLSLRFNPRVLLEVTLPQTGGPAPITLHAGVQLQRSQTAGPPTFRAVGLPTEKKGPFVIAAVDPDAPTPQTPTSAQIRHFLGGNFFVEGTQLVNRTAAISAYRQPTPPAGSPAHRYIFLLYEQSAAFARQTLVTSTTSIALFNISSFASQVGLGEPIAGTFMLVAPAT